MTSAAHPQAAVSGEPTSEISHLKTVQSLAARTEVIMPPRQDVRAKGGRLRPPKRRREAFQACNRVVRAHQPADRSGAVSPGPVRHPSESSAQRDARKVSCLGRKLSVSSKAQHVPRQYLIAGQDRLSGASVDGSCTGVGAQLGHGVFSAMTLERPSSRPGCQAPPGCGRSGQQLIGGVGMCIAWVQALMRRGNSGRAPSKRPPPRTVSRH